VDAAGAKDVTPETVTVVLPLPPAVLSQNARGHWHARAAASSKCRRLAQQAVESQQVQGWQQATVAAAFFHRIERRRDFLNSMAMLKPYIDGAVVDTGLLPDDDSEHLSPLPPSFGVDKATPRVELRFTRTK